MFIGNCNVVMEALAQRYSWDVALRVLLPSCSQLSSSDSGKLHQKRRYGRRYQHSPRRGEREEGSLFFLRKDSYSSLSPSTADLRRSMVIAERSSEACDAELGRVEYAAEEGRRDGE